MQDDINNANSSINNNSDSNNNNSEDELKKKQQKDSETKTSGQLAKTGLSAAASAFGTPLAGKVVNVASNILPDELVGKAANIASPSLKQASKAIEKTGLSNEINQGLKLASGGLSKDGTLPKDSINSNKQQLQTPNNTSDNKQTSNGINVNTDGINKSESSDATSSGGSKSSKSKSNWLILTMIGGPGCALLFPMIIVLFIIMVYVADLLGIATNANNFINNGISGVINNIVNFILPGEQATLEQQFYQELYDIQEEIEADTGICIDINLIVASLKVDSFFQDIIIDGESDEVNGTKLDYKKMIKQVELLANMQIKRKKYGWDSRLGNNIHCIDGTKDEYELVNSENQGYFVNPAIFGENGKDSSTAEEVSKHDADSYFNFFTKDAAKEKNYEYWIYRPIYVMKPNKLGVMVKTCDATLDKDEREEPELSIGTLETREDAVYYWNLVNSFIPEYYAELLPESEPERTQKIHDIAYNIYYLYDQIGPSQTCGVSYAGPSSLCPSGITIDGVGTMHLEEYVAGVVSNEAYNSEGMEALKAQAVAARTYALKITDYCQSSIENSTNAQTFTRDVNDRAREATNSTSGEILIDREGKIFAANYDSFCYDDKDCPDAVKNSDGTYTVTYTKVPYGEKHKITLSDSSQYGRILPGQGHGRGMSQLLSYELAKDGKSYREILSYFYSDGVEISLVLSPSNTDGATIVRGPISNYLENANSSISDMNQYIYSQVSKAGIGTRDGVVAAATSLVSGFYNKTGLKLPYELFPSGKYSGYGMDPSWGTNTGRGDYPLNGLDCSGFISWAIHNGGFGYELKNAQGWGNAGIKRSWSKGATDSSARAGDLIYNAPASSNGTSGHIRMIIGVTSDGYIVAEASGKKNGVRINNISFTSTGSYYLVDMSSYYANATVVNDYPM